MSDSALKEVQKNAGAVFADPNSALPSDFGDSRAEYIAALEQSAVFDLSDRTQIEITGGDRTGFLHNFCTNDIKSLQPGEGCEAFLTNVKGRVLGHVFVFVGEESIWLETAAGCEESLLMHLDRYIITDDVQLHGRTAERGELFVSGPRAVERLGRLKIVAAPLEPCAHATAEINDTAVSLRRVDLLSRPGFLLSSWRGGLANLWNRLIAAGIRAAGTAAFEALRIEATMPLYGVDISDENLAQEVGRSEQAISFRKGCYLGQEPIARLDAMGHVNRELCGLRLSCGPVPEPGCKIVAGDDQKEIGRVTSSALSFAEERPVALAYLGSRFVAAGTQVAARIGEQSISATVFQA